MLFVTLSVIASVVVMLWIAISFHFRYFSRQGIVGPKPKFPFGNTMKGILKQRSIIYDIDDVYREFKGKAAVAGFFTLFTPYVLLLDPGLIKVCRKFRNNDFAVSSYKKVDENCLQDIL